VALTVTATASGAGSSNGIEVAVRVLNNASLAQSGAVVNSETVTTPQLSVTPGASGSLVYGAAGTGASATAFSSIDSGTTSVIGSTVVSGGYWGIYKSTSTTTGGTPKSYGWAAPTATAGNYYAACAEIKSNGGTIAEDASTPAVASTAGALTITTASFTPPGSSVLVAVVLTSWSGSGAVNMALTDSASAYTWTQLSGTGTTDLVSVWAGIPKSPSPFRTPPQARRRPAARKARLASSPGSPLVRPVPGLGLLRTEAGGVLRTEGGGRFLVEGAVTPSPFAPPSVPARGKPKARKARASGSAASPAAGGAPPVPSPFTLPAKPAKGRPAARKARSASSAGSPVVLPTPSAFAPPPKPARGRPAASKSRLASSPGAPLVIPSPFAAPAQPTRGKRAAGKSRAASSAGSPLVLPSPVPSPFAPPVKPAKGKSAAAKGRLASSPGSPVVAPPPITPSPFTQPAVVTRTKGVLRKGRAASSPGSPAVPSPSPFAVPAKAVRGKAAARRSRAFSSPGSPLVIPSPFTLPGTLKRGKAAARKARAAFSAGSPVVLPAGAPSPFAVPSRPARGRPAAAKARLRSSAGSPAVVPGWMIIGTMAQTATTSLPLTPTHIGDLIFVDVVSVGAPPTGISGGGCTWQQVGPTLTGVVNAGDYAAAYEGTVITTGSIAATLAFSGAPTTIRAVAQEAQSTTGAWIVDGPVGNLDSSGTNTLPSLSPTAPGDLYIGYTFDNSTATAGTTPGYVYDIDSHGNGLAFNPDCGSGAQAPVWGTSTCAIGISVLFRAVVPSPPATPSPFAPPVKAVRGKRAAVKSRLASSAGSPVVITPPPPPPPVFPAVPLDLRAELNLGTWTDVSTYAYQRDGSSPPVTITRGKPDESGQANPASCMWQLNNRDGRFSPKNPLSPYYGQLIRNTPVRWSVPAVSSYLRLEDNDADRAFVNDQTRLGITGSIEVRAALRVTGWQGGALAHKWDGGTCWYWLLNDDGTMSFGWWTGSAGFAAASTVPVPHASGDMALRVTMNASTGTVTFYAGSAISGAYAQLGSAVSPTGGAPTSIAVSATSALVAGYIFSFSPGQLFGRIYELQLWNGLAGSGGTLAADGVFSAQSAGAASWTDSQGNVWAIAGGAEVSDRDYRFHGEMSQMPPKWDVTGNDMWVAAQAGGPLRRLGQGTNNALSAMKRAILLQTGVFAPVAYWPMEDAAGSSVFGSATGGPPVTFDTSPAPSLATDSSFVCSAPLPQLNGSRLQATVPPYDDTGTWTVRFLLNLSAPSADATLLRIVASPWAACPVLYVNADTSGNLEFIGYEPGGSEAFNTGYVAFGAAGNPLMISVEAQPASGGNTQYSLVAVAPGASSGGEVGGTASGSAGTVSVVQPDVTGAFTGTAFGHLQVQSAWQSLFAFGEPLNAWTGETAAARYARLAGENGYQVRIMGAPAVSVAMGPQGQGTLSALLQECETADSGQQFEPREVLALGYRTLASMCSQSPALELDYAASEPGGVSGDGGDNGLDPAYDDLLSKNDWTVTRGAASGNQGATVQVTLDDGSAMSVGAPPNGMGDYANTATVNTEYDDQLQDVAGWMVHAGTVDDLRWPVIPVNLARPEMAALLQDAVDLDLGDMIQIDDAPDVVIYDPVKQVVLGTKESLGGFHWTMEFNAVPENVYEVIVLGDPDTGRCDTDGSQLASGVSATATTLSVATTGPSGILWTTSAADFPLDVNVGGERMTATNITGSSSPQAFTVVRSVNGVVKAQSAGTDVRLWFPPILALT
jgi:hypothetical protein